MNNVEIEKVEMTKLLGVTLDCKLSWSKRVDTTVAKGRSLSMVRCCSTFLTALSTRQVLQALVLLRLDYCLVVLSGATKKDRKIGSKHGSKAGPWMYCTQRANINNMHINLSWL
jgi:hypothetical protein